MMALWSYKPKRKDGGGYDLGIYPGKGGMEAIQCKVCGRDYDYQDWLDGELELLECKGCPKKGNKNGE